MTTKDFRFDIKDVGDDGTFEGWLSVYDVVDLGNDVVRHGAFTKTITEQGGRVPMLWQHDTKQPIGSLELIEKPEGLWVKGTFLLEIQQAKEAYALIKNRVIRGLSIGYKAIADKVKMISGVRNLFEVKLYEGSIVTFPMLPAAQIETVKSNGAKDFTTALDEADTWMRRRMMEGALTSAFDEIIWGDGSASEKLNSVAESIDQFRSAYLNFLPKLLALRGDKSAEPETKLSGANVAAAREIIQRLEALLPAQESTSKQEAAPPVPVAAAKNSEPDFLHSLREYTQPERWKS